MSELLEQQFLTFSLRGEKYAIPVGRVFEVLEYGKITRLPCAETYLKGLINLRGQGVPVLDLALRFGLPETEATRDTAIIVVELDRKEGALIVGLIADAVHEVVEARLERRRSRAEIRSGASSGLPEGRVPKG